MGLNKSTGNMYPWITNTWNTIKGACPHDCSYCYMKRWGKLNPVRFDEKELKTDLGSGRFVFVGSSCDMFAWDISYEWIIKTIRHCEKFDNRYLFQSKNPIGFKLISSTDLKNYSLCTTIETNRWYDIMGNSPYPLGRAIDFSHIDCEEKYVTIEPIMEFDLLELVSAIELVKPVQVNIGGDSQQSSLPEPTAGKIIELIHELEKFTIVKKKKNLNRLLCL